MAEFSSGNNSEILPSEVRNHLKLATAALLRVGAGVLLQEDRRLTHEFADDYYIQDDAVGEKNQLWYKKHVDMFFNAELPMAILVRKITPDDEESICSLVKVDERGHAYLAYMIELFMINNAGVVDSALDLNFIAQPKEIAEEFTKTVISLAEMQKQIDWQPIFEPYDMLDVSLDN